MFFLVSKIFYFLLTPIVWICIACTWAFFTKSTYIRKRILVITGVCAFFLSNSFLVNEAMRAWEIKMVHVNTLDAYEYGIVLGGFNTYNEDFDRLNFSGASDRLWQALLLYNKGIVSKILISGGEGTIKKTGFTESKTTRDFLIKIGVPEADIYVESKSRNTAENAQETALIIPDCASCLLITSASHMRRARACFKKAGLNCNIFPTDSRSKARSYSINNLIIPELAALETWRVLIREIAGYYTYKIFGYL